MFKKSVVVAAALLGLLGPSVFAQSAPTGATFNAIVVDAVGRAVPGATVTLTDSQGKVSTVQTGADGALTLTVPPGAYTLRASKPSFAVYSAPLRLAAGASAPQRITLDLAPMQQSQVVTATGVPTPETQLGQSVQVLDQSAIAARNSLTLADALRDLTGVQVTQDGAVGGLASLSLRGADASFDTILLDGVPLQRFDYGAYDFSTLLPQTLDSVTVVSGGDSVVYGPSAASGVIDMRSRSGAGVETPELLVDTMAGSYGTVQQTTQLLGQWRPIDYAFAFNYLDMQNQVPNNKDWNQGWSGNVGIRLPARASVRWTLHRTATRAGDPNAYEFFGIADDSMQRQGETYGSVFTQQQTTANWHNQLTLSQSEVNYFFETAAPSGTSFNPFGYGANYLGNVVTINGANGYSVTGQAILDYGGIYPSLFASDSLGRFLNYESEYAISPLWKLVGGYRYDQQQTVSAPVTAWHDNGLFAEVSGGEWNRLFGSAGVSEDMHSAFGNSFNPQVSLALLPRLTRGGWWDEIRLHANASTATIDPTITEEQSSLYQVAVGAEGVTAANSLNLAPMQPQRAHTFEMGADQYLARDRVRLSLTGFDDRYDDLIEFVPNTAFPLLGLSTNAAAAADAEGGAYLNSLSESSKGVETALDARLGGHWHGSVSYTYLVPVVLRSFSSDAVAPAYNPAFPTIPIGAFAPLVGARPFDVAPESGAVVVGYDAARWLAQFDAVALSRRDASTFLTDGYLGDTMLLPNHDLAPAYTALNLSGVYHLTSRVTLEGVVDNLLNQNYQEQFGYPSLGRAARVGVNLVLTKPR